MQNYKKRGKNKETNIAMLIQYAYSTIIIMGIYYFILVNLLSNGIKS